MTTPADRLRRWNDGDNDVPVTYTYDSLEFQRDLRALLAEMDALVSEKDRLARMHATAFDLGVSAQAERDAAVSQAADRSEWIRNCMSALAERDAARAQLHVIVEWAIRHGKEPDWLGEAHAVLTGAKP